MMVMPFASTSRSAGPCASGGRASPCQMLEILPSFTRRELCSRGFAPVQSRRTPSTMSSIATKTSEVLIGRRTDKAGILFRPDDVLFARLIFRFSTVHDAIPLLMRAGCMRSFIIDDGDGFDLDHKNQGARAVAPRPSCWLALPDRNTACECPRA